MAKGEGTTMESEQILNRVKVAAPCPANWNYMEGDERVRRCALCKLNVYNLSEMNREDAAALVSQTEGRLCVRYYQRRDGTLITRDCPVGIRAIRKRLASVVACAFVLFTAGIAFASNLSRRGPMAYDSSTLLRDAKDRLRQTDPFKSVLNWIDPPQPSHAVVGNVLMGAVAAPIPIRPSAPQNPSRP